MFWEFGEHLAWLLSPLASRLPKWLVCRCEERRRWLNETGERWFKWLWFREYTDLRRRFSGIVMVQLERRVTPAKELAEILRSHRMNLSDRTVKRWIGQLPVKVLIMFDEPWYGL